MEALDFLATLRGHCIPIFNMGDGLDKLDSHVRAQHPGAKRVMAGDGVVWVDRKGHVRAIAGNPASHVMSMVRTGRPLPF